MVQNICGSLCSCRLVFFVCPGPGVSKGNLIDLPASKEADESKQGFFSFVSCSLVFLTDIQKESYSEVALAKRIKVTGYRY